MVFLKRKYFYLKEQKFTAF